MSKGLKVIFWGVRGSYPVPGIATQKIGGNTSCVQLRAAERNIILDAGTGICQLGKSLLNKRDGIYDLFLTHIHWDHVLGFPFFKPLYHESNQINIYGPNNLLIKFKEMFQEPFFPLSLNQLKANINFIKLKDKEQINFSNDLIVKTYPGKHSSKSLIYKVEYFNKKCSYLVDYEHPVENDSALEAFISKSDLLIYDAHFTAEEYQGENQSNSKKGWGHSTWQEGIKLAKKTKVKKLAFFHHDPDKNDQVLLDIAHKASNLFPASFLAKEGMELLI